MAMTIGALMCELHLGSSRSLKEKRMVLNRLKGRLKSRFNVSVAEVDHQDLWQRAGIAVVCVASDKGVVEKTLEASAGEIERELPGEVLECTTEFLT